MPNIAALIDEIKKLKHDIKKKKKKAVKRKPKKKARGRISTKYLTNPIQPIQTPLIINPEAVKIASDLLDKAFNYNKPPTPPPDPNAGALVVPPPRLRQPPPPVCRTSC